MTFAGPGKRDDELEAGIAAGATISVESEGEAAPAILAGETRRHPAEDRGPREPAVRHRGRPRDHGRRPSPFGVDAERVPALVQGLIEAGVDWRGLHMFAGAQCLDAAALIDAHKAIVACAGEIAEALDMPLPELNLGGGFDVPCFAGEEPLDIYRIAGALHDTFCDGPELLATTRLSLELGRWLVGEAGRLSDPRPRPHRKLRRRPSSPPTAAAIICCAPPAACWSAGAAIIRSRSPTASTPPREEQVTVTGCLATPHDVFGDDVDAAACRAGRPDRVFCAGAYGLTRQPAELGKPPGRRAKSLGLGVDRLDEIEAVRAAR